jgi:hypothetical protein
VEVYIHAADGLDWEDTEGFILGRDFLRRELHDIPFIYSTFTLIDFIGALSCS